MRSGRDIGARGGSSRVSWDATGSALHTSQLTRGRIRIPRERRGGLRAWTLLLCLAALPLARPAAAAPPPSAPPASSDVPRLEAECARLRAELDRTNAEIVALKRGNRGLRDDYRLRQRMADAEALARKLTQSEAQLRAQKTPAPTARPPLTVPAAAPGDGPVELEAKADLLADQARRLTAEADSLTRAATQIRGRQILRRRAADLERDPFGGVETSKRNMLFGRPTARVPTSGGDTVAPPPRTGAPGLAPQPGAAPVATSTATAPASAALSQVRTVIDPATLTEVQRLERTGKPLAEAEALERAAAALRQRAQALDEQAKRLRKP
jgi:hypothetical protein